MPNGAKEGQIGQDGVKQRQTRSNIVESVQMYSNGAKRGQTGPSGAKQDQTGPNGANLNDFGFLKSHSCMCTNEASLPFLSQLKKEPFTFVILITFMCGFPHQISRMFLNIALMVPQVCLRCL